MIETHLFRTGARIAGAAQLSVEMENGNEDVIPLCGPHMLGYGPPADMWSAGRLLYIMLAETVPFENISPSGTEDDLWVVMQNILQNRVLWADVEGCSPALVPLVRKLMVIDPRGRLTAAGVLQELAPAGSCRREEGGHGIRRRKRAREESATSADCRATGDGGDQGDERRRRITSPFTSS